MVSLLDGFVKSPSAALRFTFVVAAYLVSTPHSSGFARLAYGAFYLALPILTFYEIIFLNYSQCPQRFSLAKSHSTAFLSAWYKLATEGTVRRSRNQKKAFSL